ncbi:MAG: prepilin-type N-terminal cleavage/methylation domain-containing protein [Candidatus Saccharimonas sp.]
MNHSINKGLTAVELIIAIVIAMILLGSAYQMYAAVLRNSGESQSQATASNVAYDLVRQYQKKATTPCNGGITETPALPSYAQLPSGKATAAISCPFGNSSTLSLVKVTVTYTDPDPQEVVRAIVTNP